MLFGLESSPLGGELTPGLLEHIKQSKEELEAFGIF